MNKSNSMGDKRNIAIFASGSGTNAENIVRYFKDSEIAQVKTILSNKSDAYVLRRAEKLKVPVFVFNRIQFRETGEVLKYLKDQQIDFIVLAGFLWLVPADIIREYRGRIVNIHPALLPRHGGKGMYGDRVHQAVLDEADEESGITIHHVNEKYDDGDIIFQARCKVVPGETVESLAKKVHQLEYEHYPKVVENLIISQ